MHCLPTGDRVFGTLGIWVVDGMNGLKVFVFGKAIVGGSVWRGDRNVVGGD